MRSALACVLLLAACQEEPPYVEPRQPCAQNDPLKQVYFGDLHVHTSYSFDAYLFDLRNTPFDAYRFARGEELTLPPLGPDGKGTRRIRLDRPLDFAAVTDHSEFLGEVEETQYLLARKPFDPQQMASVENEGGCGRNVH